MTTKTLGLDIGTTTISAVVYGTAVGVLKCWNVKNDAFLPGENPDDGYECSAPSACRVFRCSPFLGRTSDGIPVYTAIGDNQASFLGAVNGRNDAVLINMGIGGQISVYSPAYLQAGAMATRPFPVGGWLLVGASLCGGRSYALLERFFRQTVELVTGESRSAYNAMMAALDSSDAPQDFPLAITTFQGTRTDPFLRGSFPNASEDNFTPVHFMHSILHGMAEELFSFYQTYLNQGGKAPTLLTGSGNALRKNKHLCRIFESGFGCNLLLSENEEEAACGAAIYALKHCDPQ